MQAQLSRHFALGAKRENMPSPVTRRAPPVPRIASAFLEAGLVDATTDTAKLASAGRSLAHYAQQIISLFIASHVLPATHTMSLQAAATSILLKLARALQNPGMMQTRPATVKAGDI